MNSLNSGQAYARKSYIKDIGIPLPEYQFYHKSFNEKDDDNFHFLGREESRKKIVDIILNGKNSGAYLVSGYRGMGKTSFVNSVLKESGDLLKKKKSRQLRLVNVSFGKSNLVYGDLLRQLMISMMDRLITSLFHKAMIWVIKPTHIFFLAGATFIALAWWLYEKINIFDKEFNLLPVTILLLSVSFAASFLLHKIACFVVYLSPSIRIYNKLNQLYTRSKAEVSEEENIQSVVKNINFGVFSKSTAKYPPLTPKEIELKLIDIINRIDQHQKPRFFRRIRKILDSILINFGYYRANDYVFIFDELDKIDPGVGGEEYYKDIRDSKSDEMSKTYIDEQRDRKQMMVNIISSLKNLITESQAKFIFITGREMFEASMADIADRQFSLGSIFHKIIYIDSFLKDRKGSDPAGLSNLIENYLKTILLPRSFLECWLPADLKSAPSLHYDEKPCWDTPFLSLYYEFLNNSAFVDQSELVDAEKAKIIQALQQFIIFLTYRSNGSPKKLIRLVEDFVSNWKHVREFSNGREFCLSVHLRSGTKRNQKREPISNSEQTADESLYLHLTYNTQFRFGFITYLYRPFLLNYSRRLKNNSDYLLVSTTYLLDHILKFHPVAFSTRNLELLPEVLSTNRTPQLRSFIDSLLQFLSYSYIRDTGISLFEYRFYNTVSNEIYHLTSLFEEESAAFNFTLDESYPIKIHIRNKILELRKIHKDYRSIQSYEFIHSISALNNLLGDVRYFDQEYNDAITAYSDALQALRNIDEKYTRRIEIVILIIQLQLKIGLTFEKIKTYENSLAYFTDAMQYCTNIILRYANLKSATSGQGPATPEASVVSVTELLQTSIQAFIANLYLIEKMSSNGVTMEKVNYTLELLETLFDTVRKSNNPDLISSNCLHHISILVFYKNFYFVGIKGHQDFKFCRKELDTSKLEDAFVAGNSARNLGPDFRFPNVGFLMSLCALKRILLHFKSLDPHLTPAFSNIFDSVPVNISTLFLTVFKLLSAKEFRRIADNSSLSSLGASLSLIGDILLTNIEHDPSFTTTEASPQSVFLSQLFPESLITEFNEAANQSDFRPEDFFSNLNIEILQNSMTDGFINGSVVERIRFIFLCYFYSSKYYSAAGKMAHCSFQLKRILRLTLSTVCINPKADPLGSNYDKFIYLLERGLLAEILKNISYNSNSTDRAQIMRYKYYIGIKSMYIPIERTREIYGSLSNSPEIREAIIMFAKLKTFATELKPAQINEPLNRLLPEQIIVNSSNIISHQWTRVLELEFQAQLNWKVLKEVVLPNVECVLRCLMPDLKSDALKWLRKVYEIYRHVPVDIIQGLRSRIIKRDAYIAWDIAHASSEGLKNADSDGVLWEFYRGILEAGRSDTWMKTLNHFASLTANSIHCLNHIIEIIQTYGVNYPASYCFIGDQYRKLGNWMQLYYLIIEIQHVVPVKWDFLIDKEVQKLVGIELLRTLEPTTLFQTAIVNYRSALELHHDGNTYKNKIQSLNYLDDDFSDNVDHFVAALERQRINSGNIRRRINSLSNIIDGSQLLRYRSYVN